MICKLYTFKNDNCAITNLICLILLFTPFYSNATKVIKAVTLNYPPYEYLENNKPTGLAIDIIKEVVSRMGDSKVEFSFFPWGRSVLETKIGNQDILFNAGVSEERKRWGAYVETVLIEQQYMFFALKGSKFTVSDSLDNVSNLRLGTRMHYLYGDGVLKTALDKKHFKQVSAVNSIEQNVKMLLKDRVDLFVGDYLPVMYYLEKNCLLDRVRIIKKQETKSNLVVLHWNTHLLVSKKSPMFKEVGTINKVLLDMKKDGTFFKISQPYYQFSKSQQDCQSL